MTNKIRLPNSTHRLAVVGRTGSGKTVASVWHLSNQPIEKMPWVIFDFKTDELINSIKEAEHVNVGFIPKKPGLYIVHPLPSESDAVESYLWKLWERQRIGIYVDEGYMMGNSEGFDACLTQGRSRHIPMIVCTQRPAWITRFVFSESDFYQVFSLNDKRDRKTIESFVPVTLDDRLPDFHSHYYDVGKNQLYRFSPVPSEDEILSSIAARIPRRMKRI
jgi:hypothetical protein